MGNKGDATKQRIKLSAQTIFSKKGYKETTMKDICEATGLSRGGLYRHYESTQQIFREIICDATDATDNKFYSKMEQGVPAQQILEEILAFHKMEMRDCQNSLSMAIYEYFSTPQSNEDGNILLKQYHAYVSIWNDIIQYGIKRNEFKVVDANAVCDLFMFAYQGVRMYSKLMPIDEKTPERIIEQIRTLLLK